jgi:hypothetical protein
MSDPGHNSDSVSEIARVRATVIAASQPSIVTVLGFVSIAMFVVFSTYLVARGERLF